MKLRNQIGARQGASEFLTGEIDEIIIATDRSESNRQKLEGYAAHKWDDMHGNTNLVDRLASDHPYKDSPP